MIQSSLQEASHFEYFGHFTYIFGHSEHVVFEQTCLTAWGLIHFKLDRSQLVSLKIGNSQIFPHTVWFGLGLGLGCPSPRCTET